MCSTKSANYGVDGSRVENKLKWFMTPSRLIGTALVPDEVITAE